MVSDRRRSGDETPILSAKLGFDNTLDARRRRRPLVRLAGLLLMLAAVAALLALPQAPPVLAGAGDATGQPSISGVAQVGETLTASTSDIADEDGLNNVVFSYQWIRNDGTEDTEIQGATESTYELSNADVGKTIKVRVGFQDDDGFQEARISEATETVTCAPIEGPLWSAKMLVVEYTSVSIGAASADLFSNVSSDVCSGGIKVKSLWSYTPDRDLRLTFEEGVLDPEGLTLQVGDLRLAFPAGSSTGAFFKWTDVDIDWEDGQILAVRIEPTSARSNSSATGLPSISGTAQIGEVLTADATNITDADGLDSATFSYQWVSNDGNVGTEIEGATDATYTLVPADFGKTIKVRVSFTDNFGSYESRASAPTGPVKLAPPQPVTGAPTIIGMIGVGETLTASVSDIQDGNGLDGVEFSYQWLLSDGSLDTEIEGAADASYTLVTVDVSKTIKVRVSFTDQGGHPESRTSAPLAPSPRRRQRARRRLAVFPTSARR